MAAVIVPTMKPLVKALMKITAFTPYSLFTNGEQGAWYDPSDLTTLYQDDAGTIPVTADGDPVGLMLDKSGNGNHASQSVTGAKPIYRTDGTLHWLEFDGVDDALLIPEIFTGSQDRSIFLSYRGTGAGTAGLAPLVCFGDIATTGAAWQLHEESTLALRIGGNKLYTRTADLNDHVISNYWSTSLGSTTSSTAVARLDGSVLPTASESAVVINTVGGSGSVGVRLDGPYYYSLRLYGLIICRSIYAATTISSTEQYLATKSGVTL